MATFGFSVGDFIAFLGVVKDVTKALKESSGSASEYRGLIQTLESLDQALTISGLVYLQWQSLPATAGYRKSSQAMINGMLFHRQQCKELIDGFLTSTKSYGNAFLGPFPGYGSGVKKNFRKITWLFQKDKVFKLELNLQRHLKALQIYSDGLFQSQMGTNAAKVSSDIGRILSNIADVHTEVSTISTALQTWQRPVASLGYSWEDNSSLAQSVVLFDAIGRNLNLPLMFFSSPKVFHDLLYIMYRGIPGSKKIMRREYTITEENEEETLIEEENWGRLIRPGMRLALNMILKVSSSWNTSQCPKCKEATLGHALPGKRIRCHKCQLIYRVFEHERFVEAGDAFTRPPPAEDDIIYINGINAKSAGISSRLPDMNIMPQNLRNLLPESSYFKRVHYHREVLKLLPALDQSDPSSLVPQRFEESDPLHVELLPPLHKYAAKGDLNKIAQLLDNGEGVDTALPFGANLHNDGVDCEFDGCTPLHLACWFGQTRAINFLLDHGAVLNKKSSTGREALSFGVLGEDPGVAMLLLRRGADVHSKDAWQQTPFHEACMKSNAVLVHLFLEYGADLTARDENGRTALHHASSREQRAVVNALLLNDAEVTVEDHFGETPLHRAAWNGCKEVSKLLLAEGAKINIKSKRGYTPLHDACTQGHNGVVDVLLEHGANVEVQAENGTTPLHESAINGHESVVMSLISHGVNVDSKNSRGCTVLHDTAAAGLDTIFQAILDYGGSIEARDNLGSTPLHYAAINGRTTVVRALLKQGVGVSCPNQSGNTPLHLACKESCEGDYEEIIRDLVMSDPSALLILNEDGNTPLHLACSKDVESIARLLLTDSGQAAATIQNNARETPLFIASCYGSGATVRLLLKIDPDMCLMRAHHNRTPLIIASGNGHFDAVELLLRTHPTSVDISDDDDTTPLHKASEHGHGNITNILIENGAKVNSQNKIGQTPLFLACCGGFVEVVKKLLYNNANPLLTENTDMTTLHAAASIGSVEIIRLLLENNNIDPSSKMIHDIAPIHLAAIGGHLDAVRALVDAGANLEAKIAVLGFAALHYAIIHGHQPVIRVLIDAGASVETKTAGFEFAPVHMAASQGDAIAIQALAGAGADLNVEVTSFGLNSLHLACLYGHLETVRVLLDAGCDPWKPSSWGYVALDVTILGYFAYKNPGARSIAILLQETDIFNNSLWDLDLSGPEIKVKSVSLTHYKSIVKSAINMEDNGEKITSSYKPIGFLADIVAEQKQQNLQLRDKLSDISKDLDAASKDEKDVGHEIKYRFKLSDDGLEIMFPP